MCQFFEAGFVKNNTYEQYFDCHEQSENTKVAIITVPIEGITCESGVNFIINIV
ncbi:277_t:CDS:2 [Gigaspora margarita]|uniref:277_t:CDS:1 n=1 Tax=Gigaspora margarita TaxID=4874 RepID=A0ABN7UDU3_GIGMA|nr:277_t:CDS:2 [Gigaspora margarita]